MMKIVNFSRHKGITTAPQMVWMSDGARGFGRLFEQRLADVAIGILDFYHAAQQLWEVAGDYGNTLPTYPSTML